MELPNHAKQLLLQLNQQRAKGFLCDVIIVVENALFRAHKNILAASSIYFKSLMLHDNLINLDTEMVNPSVFRQILDFIYTGKLLSSDQTCDQNFNALLTAASYLQLHDLAALCRKKLKRHGKSFSSKPMMASVGRVLRKQKPPSSAVAKGRFSGLRDGEEEQHRDEPSLDRLSDEENLGCDGAPIASGDAFGQLGSKNGSNDDISSSSSSSDANQESGLDLSKKSPSGSTVTDEVSPQSRQLELPLSTSTSTVNGAPCDDCPTHSQNPLENSVEPMELVDEGLKDGQAPMARGQLRKGSREVAPKQEWTKRDGNRGEAVGKPVPNGVVAGSKATSHHSVPEDVENGREHSEDSGQSESEGGHGGVNYVYRQEGFEPSVGDDLYVCIPCGKGFPSSEQLNAHVETHAEAELFVAEDLSSSTTPPPALGAEPRPFRCSMCSKTYKDLATLRQHEKSHWLTRPFPCNICGKMFTQRGTMTRHMRSHLGLKPFACEECGMRFTRQYRLTEHMRVHSGEKPYECQLCGGKFTQQRNLISHLRMHTSPA